MVLFKITNMEKSLWSFFCSDPHHYSTEAGKEHVHGFLAIEDPSSCPIHVLTISVDALFLITLLCFSIYKSLSRNILVTTIGPSESHQHSTPLILSSTIFNDVIGFGYLGSGVLMIIEKLRTEHTLLPLHGWLVMILQGLTWLSLAFTLSLKKLSLPRIKVCSVLAFLFSTFLFASSVWEAVVYKVVTINMVLGILCFPGAVLFLFSAFSFTELSLSSKASYQLLQAKEEGSDDLTPFAKSGFLSKMSFWWLDPLMKQGKKKTLQVEDVPQLRQEDRAKTCYLMYKMAQEGSSRSVLFLIMSCQWKAILITGFFALIKVLSLSSGPLLLRAFIRVAEGNPSFENEGYVLAIGLFAEKCLESFSERQWFFGTRLIGLQVRSLLSAAIYQKQLRLSNLSKLDHSTGEIMSYVTVDAFRIGEFPIWFHQIWTTSLQLCLSLFIVYYSIGLATLAVLLTLIFTALVSYPLGKLQQKYQTKLMQTQDKRLKAITETLSNIKVLKMYAWEEHFKNAITKLRGEEATHILSVLKQKGYYTGLFWSSPILVPVVTIWVCYVLGIKLNASNLFTFLACVRLAQQPIRLIPDVAGVFIAAKVSLGRIVRFLEAAELENEHVRLRNDVAESCGSVFVSCDEVSWEGGSMKATLRNIDLVVSPGEKVAVCGEVGSGKSTLLAAILGEVPHVSGTVRVCGKVAYVSQTGWIQTGTIQENILFGSVMDPIRYEQVLKKCSLTQDLDAFPFGDLTQLGERGVNLSGGQKQRVQLARALYQNADVYLLDDPFSAVDAHTATSLFNEYVIEALAGKTVILVTHQVDFLPAFNSVLLMSAGEISIAASFDQLLKSSTEFQNLVHAHNETQTTASERPVGYTYTKKPETFKEDIQKPHNVQQLGDQLIKQEEKEIGDTGLKPYIQYINHDKGLFFFSMIFAFHVLFVVGQLLQNYWLASEIGSDEVSIVELITVYSVIGCVLALLLFCRSICTVLLAFGVSKSMFTTLMDSLFRAPMSFYDATPLGRILSRVCSDVSIIDTELAFKLSIALGSAVNAYAILGVLAIITWPVLFVIIPLIFLTFILQRYYIASAKEFMRMNGTTKSLIASHVSESIAGVMTIRAFGKEGRFFSKALDLIDANASTNFHSFSANEWLIQRLEILSAIVLSSSALAMTLLEVEASSPGLAGMALAYGLSLNSFLVLAVQQQCLAENSIISVERMEQYMHLPSESPEVIEDSRPASNWPSFGKVEICDLKVRYRPNAPLVLHGINCTVEGGHKVGIVGRTGCGKTTLISALFRLVEPAQGKIMVDGLDISTIGLHDLRSRLGIIPQEPTLFSGSVRYNLDPLSEHTDMEIWEVLKKCQLLEAIKEKHGLDSIVAQHGSNWSKGQRQLFCLGRALLKRSRILVLDEATASIDNATDQVLQKTIRTEFAHCTVITVAHRVPTVIDCDMVLAISDGKVVEYEEPMKLIKEEGSLFGQLYKEYWSRGTIF